VVPSLAGFRVALLVAAGAAALAAAIVLTLPAQAEAAVEDWSPDELELEDDPLIRG
jgi:hypothetical protein